VEKELSRKEALKLWSELRQKGWQACSPPMVIASTDQTDPASPE
jgi:hypothetical protein